MTALPTPNLENSGISQALSQFRFNFVLKSKKMTVFPFDIVCICERARLTHNNFNHYKNGAKIA